MSRAAMIVMLLLSAVSSAPVGGGEATGRSESVVAIDLPILVYHRITCLMGNATRMDERMTVAPDEFVRQMEQLRDEGYTTVALEDLRAALAGEGDLPTKPVAITFDDGWLSQYAEAVPVLRRLGFKATFFIHTDGVGTPNHLTWDHVREIRDAGMEVGSHTMTHARLPGLEPGAMLRELAGSRDRIEHELDSPIDLLAYPFGETNDQVIAAAGSIGYRLAVTTDPGNRQEPGDLLRLHRSFVGFFDGPDEFAAALDGHVNWEPMRAARRTAEEASRNPG